MIDVNKLSTLEYDGNPVDAFKKWYKKNPMGKSIIYFSGFLAECLSYEKNEPIGKMQKHVLNMSGRGEVQLTQFRHGERMYSYIARKMVE